MLGEGKETAPIQTKSHGGILPSVSHCDRHAAHDKGFQGLSITEVRSPAIKNRSTLSTKPNIDPDSPRQCTSAAIGEIGEPVRDFTSVFDAGVSASARSASIDFLAFSPSSLAFQWSNLTPRVAGSGRRTGGVIRDIRVFAGFLTFRTLARILRERWVNLVGRECSAPARGN